MGTFPLQLLALTPLAVVHVMEAVACPRPWGSWQGRVWDHPGWNCTLGSTDPSVWALLD